MYKLDLPVDYKEAAAIERRRLMEEQRKSRIFNAKVRTIGVSNLIFFQTSKVKWLIAGLQCNYNAPTPFHNKKESLTYKDHGILQTQHTLAYPLFVSSWNEGKRGGGDFSFSQFEPIWYAKSFRFLIFSISEPPQAQFTLSTTIFEEDTHTVQEYQTYFFASTFHASTFYCLSYFQLQNLYVSYSSVPGKSSKCTVFYPAIGLFFVIINELK